MNQMIGSHGKENEYRRTFDRELPWPTAASPTAAAKILVEAGAAQGGGTDESKVARLVKRYLEIHGDDG